MKAKYKIDINDRNCCCRYVLYRRYFWLFWKSIDESDEYEELEEKLKVVRLFPKYFE